MNGYIQVAIGSLLLSGLIAYAWWSKTRVWVFRQSLFSIRNRLRDEMAKSGQLDLQDYKRCRSLINAMIGFAPALSWWTIWTIVLHEDDLTPTHRGKQFQAENLPQPVKDAMREVEQCVLQYLFRWTLLGWFIGGLLAIVGNLGSLKSRIGAAVKAFSRSEEAGKIGHHLAGA